MISGSDARAVGLQDRALSGPPLSEIGQELLSLGSSQAGTQNSIKVRMDEFSTPAASDGR